MWSRRPVFFEEVRKRCVRGTGMKGSVPGRILVPQSKHYSWSKAADILGIGQENLISIPVGPDYRNGREGPEKPD